LVRLGGAPRLVELEVVKRNWDSSRDDGEHTDSAEECHLD
jgi:hypothetical protein